MVYKTYEFTFAGEPASMFGMFMADLGNKSHTDNPFGNVANIVETRLPNRVTPLHFGVRYHDSPLTFKLIFGSDHYLDRYQFQEVSNWLTGYQEYQWLTIDQPDMEHIQFKCLIKDLNPISIQWFPNSFEATVVCDCAYGYSYPWEKTLSVNGSLKTVFYNDSTIRENLKPDLTIQLASGTRNFSITNKTTGTTMKFTGLPAGGVTIIADNENGILRDGNDEYDLYDYFNFQFFELASGDNELVLEGNGNVKIRGRYLYNVGA